MDKKNGSRHLIVYGKHPFIAEEADELTFQPGDPILVLERDDLYNDGWWKGQTRDGTEGLFPVNFVEEIPADDLDNLMEKLDLDPIWPRSNNSDGEMEIRSSSSAQTSQKSPLWLSGLHLEPQPTGEELKSRPPPDQWSIIDVTDWLVSIGFKSLVRNFEENEITGDVLLELNLSSLRELGVENLGDRINILHSILTLKETYSKDSAYIDDYVMSSPILPSIQQDYEQMQALDADSYYNDLYDDYEDERPSQQFKSSQSPARITNSPGRYDDIDEYYDSYKTPPVAAQTPGMPRVAKLNQYTLSPPLSNPKPSPNAPIPTIPGSVKLMTASPNKVSESFSNINFASPDYEGWLHVKIGTDRGWTKRWCVLKKRCLYVMKDRPPSKAIAQIALDAGATISPDPKALKNKFAFMALSPDTPIFRFVADTQLAMVSWINVMVRAGQTIPSRAGPVPLIPIKHAGRPARTPILEGFKPGGLDNSYSSNRRENSGARSSLTPFNNDNIYTTRNPVMRDSTDVMMVESNQ